MRGLKIDTIRTILLVTAVAVTAAQPIVAHAQPAPPISPELLRQRIMTGMHRGLSDLFDRVDANRDGRITQAEATAFARTHGHQGPLGGSWGVVDINRDGVITKQELMAAASNHMNLFQGGR